LVFQELTPDPVNRVREDPRVTEVSTAWSALRVETASPG